MKILYLAAEAAPLAKVGGLGDVAGSLPLALAARGHDVRVALPFSGVIDRARFHPAVVARVPVPHVSGAQTAIVSAVQHGGVTFYLISGPPIPRAGRVYGLSIKEDGPKFIFFALAALGLCRTLDWQPDILHANDSHTGAAVYWLASDGRHDPFFQGTASVFTLHNLAYKNLHARPYLREYGLALSDSPVLEDWARDSLIALGLAHADALNTVSPTHAREILTPEYGSGLEAALRARRDRLTGILNGLDTKAWDPRTDLSLHRRYDRAHLPQRRDAKQALLRELGLPAEPDRPLLAVVSRLDPQKGLELTLPALRPLLQKQAVHFILLGTGLPVLEKAFQRLGRLFPDSVRLQLKFDAALARRIYAGADLLLIPSRYEPCGLTQLIAMRYGAVPVVRQTGGLADTVIDAKVARRGTGFVFRGYNSRALAAALRRALRAYRQPARWQALQRRGMQLDFSWSRSARAYEALYRQAARWRQQAVDQVRSRA